MSSAFKISEAASLALHTMVLFAARPDELFSTRQIASILGVSEAHLAKVLQRLARAGLARSIRGPKGGFALGKDAEQITLLDVYEVIEGPLESRNCLLATRICNGKRCIFGGLLQTVDEHIRRYMAETRLPELTGAYGGSHAKS